MSELQEPQHKIAPKAVTVWRISAIITHIILLLIIGGLITAGYLFDWVDWIVIGLIIVGVLDVLMAIWDIAISPVLTQRYWRYAISETFIQTKHGIFKKNHTVAPMTKVQYVNTEEGPILRRYRLQTLEVGTMNDSLEIPALPRDEAIALRARIAEYAKIKEVDET